MLHCKKLYVVALMLLVLFSTTAHAQTPVGTPYVTPTVASAFCAVERGYQIATANAALVAGAVGVVAAVWLARIVGAYV